MKKAIIVTSFGTTDEIAIKNDIETIENRIKSDFADYRVDRAFTSSIVMKRLSQRNIHINDLDTALNKLSDYDEVFVQPTHIIPGYEYDKMNTVIKKYKNVVIGKPLLYNSSDYDVVASFINDKFASYDGSVILVGHGTDHNADATYNKLQDLLSDNIYIVTVEGANQLENCIPKLTTKKVLLTPFLVVCGEHAKNDMNIDMREELSSNGFDVEVLLKGLGSYPEIQEIYSNHIQGEI